MNRLYAIHVSGPDSIMPTASLEEVEQKKAELNKQFEACPESECCPKCEANIVDWPYDAESHAQGLLEVDWSDVG